MFNPINFGTDDLNVILNRINIISTDITNDIFFYIVRHGEGFHNTFKGPLKTASKIISSITTSNVIDAQLTDLGILQAKSAGKALSRHLKNNIVNYLFCSDLKRTRETLGSVILEIHNNLVNVNLMYVLPCSHELDYTEELCDGNQIINAPENTVSYKRGNKCENLCCNVLVNTKKI